MSQLKREDVHIISRLVTTLRNSLVDLVEQLNQILEDLTPPKITLTSQLVDSKGTLLAEVQEGEEEVIFTVAPNIKISMTDSIIQGFLVSKVMEPLKVAQGISYTLVPEAGVLREIILRGRLTQESLEELKRAIIWALLKEAK